ncbi:alpha/beta hydrolase [Zavarzinia compransoris]|uniref:alpha/beta fold hydrolase n=1 Tax=Zavarzinia marina TaxID=2911065 RepID=UPI001F1F8EB2|nr:alpha/beta hydrolase [Zavarzinia marina]MCF4165183.1 alpha/beta hydrolase [Zavarzinia marina]
MTGEIREISIELGPETVSALEFLPAGGGAGAPLALCLHGFPDDNRTFDGLGADLAAAGFRAIAPLMPGYEPSSIQANGDYTIAGVADVLGRLMEKLADGGAVHLIGHDWGAVMGHVVAADRPDLLASWTAIAIPPTGRLTAIAARAPWLALPFWYIGVFQARGVADWLVARDDWAFIDLLWRRWSPKWTPPDGMLDHVKQTLARPGVKKAALGYYRCLASPFTGRFKEGVRRASRRIEKPSLILAGTRDGCFSVDAFRIGIRAEDYPGGVALEIIEDAGHFLHLEKPEVVNPLIVAHLRRAAASAAQAVA